VERTSKPEKPRTSKTKRPTGKPATARKEKGASALLIPDKLELVPLEPEVEKPIPELRAPREGESACEQCGDVGPTRFVLYKGNIGMIFVRREMEVNGHLCPDCDSAAFKKLTLTTLGLGWWGHLSFILTPFFLVNNVLYRLKFPGLPRPRKDGKLTTNWIAFAALILFVLALFVAIAVMPTRRPA
jgi:hypothetical protein